MARVYKLGAIVGWGLVVIASVYALVAVFGNVIYGWLHSVVSSKTFAVILARALVLGAISAIIALARELNNWRITFSPKLKVWRE
jgi:hypothetical protein